MIGRSRRPGKGDLTPEDVLRFQQTAGNQAVLRLLSQRLAQAEAEAGVTDGASEVGAAVEPDEPRVGEPSLAAEGATAARLESPRVRIGSPGGSRPEVRLAEPRPLEGGERDHGVTQEPPAVPGPNEQGTTGHRTAPPIPESRGEVRTGDPVDDSPEPVRGKRWRRWIVGLVVMACVLWWLFRSGVFADGSGGTD